MLYLNNSINYLYFDNKGLTGSFTMSISNSSEYYSLMSPYIQNENSRYFEIIIGGTYGVGTYSWFEGEGLYDYNLYRGEDVIENGIISVTPVDRITKIIRTTDEVKKIKRKK